MALKTFNLDKEAYEKFSKHCKEKGISMSKRVDNFIKSELERVKNPRKARVIDRVEKKVEVKHELGKYIR